MAGRAAGPEHDAAALRPIDAKEGGGRQILRQNDGAGRRIRQFGQAEKLAQNPVPDIRQICGARAEIGVVGRLISRDLLRQRLSPGRVGRHAALDCCIGALGQGVVFEQRHLKAHDIGSLAVKTGRQCRDGLEGSGNGVRQSLSLTCDRALHAPHLADCAKCHRRTEGEPGRCGEAGKAAFHHASLLIELACDDIDERSERGGSIFAAGLEMKHFALGRLDAHDLHRALGIGPRAGRAGRDLYTGAEALGGLGKLHRGPGMKPDLVGEQGAGRHLLHPCIPLATLPLAGIGRHLVHADINSSAVACTTASVEPPDASVAAITAPSTMGALQMTMRSRRSSGIISTAISLLVSAPPRSTRMATPASDHALSIAAMMAATSVPRPPSALPPAAASGTLSPTTWRTMSTAPSATLAECDTMTMPTFLLAGMLSGSDGVADCGGEQRR